MSTRALQPAIFLDRDGVIIENQPNYVRSQADVAFIPGALAALARLARARPDWRVVIATNQAGVGRGVLSLDTAHAINAFVRDRVQAAGGRIDRIYMCPHHPDAQCPCRKPAPGMLLQAAAELEIDLAASVFVGDALSDVQAGLAAGVRAILVRTGLGAGQAAEVERRGLAARIVPDLAAALDLVLNGAATHTNAP